jgi:biopolymer transport protein ExbD
MKIELDARPPFPNLSTSITDISFLLTIFFVIAAVFLADIGIFLSLPREDSAPRLLAPEEAIPIRVGAAAGAGEWEIALDGKPVPIGDLAAAVRALLPGKRDPVAVITVDRGVPYQEVLDVVAGVKEAGVDTFSMGVPSP